MKKLLEVFCKCCNRFVPLWYWYFCVSVVNIALKDLPKLIMNGLRFGPEPHMISKRMFLEKDYLPFT